MCLHLQQIKYQTTTGTIHQEKGHKGTEDLASQDVITGTKLSNYI